MPAGAWGRTWRTALVAAALVLGGIEGAWRLSGGRPMVEDRPDLWRSVRDRASDAGSKALVLAGLSRISFAIDPAILSAACQGREVFNLAVGGEYPLPVLEDLARDPRFTGTALVSLDVEAFLEPEAHPNAAVYSTLPPPAGLPRFLASAEASTRSFLEARLCIASHPYRARRVVGDLLRGRWPRAWWMTMTPERSMIFDDPTATFSEPDDQVRAPGRLGPVDRFSDLERLALDPAAPAGAPPWWSRVEDAAGWVERIRARGGRVVFLRMPDRLEVLRAQDPATDRRPLWRAAVRRLGAPAFHHADHPDLAGFPRRNWLHVHAENRAEFSRALLGIDSLVEALGCAAARDRLTGSFQR